MSCLSPRLRSLILMEQFLDIEEESVNLTNNTALEEIKSQKGEKQQISETKN